VPGPASNGRNPWQRVEEPIHYLGTVGTVGIAAAGAAENLSVGIADHSLVFSSWGRHCLAAWVAGIVVGAGIAAEIVAEVAAGIAEVVAGTVVVEAALAAID